MSEVHSILFDNSYYNATSARKWLKDHNYKAIKQVHKTKNKLRYRIRDPSLYKKFITKKITPHIELVLGFK